MSLDKLIARFQGVDKAVRLEAILDASNRLPALPERLRIDRDREAHRVTECQTPVFLWFEPEGERIRMYADVPREAPTVRGFVSLLLKQLDGALPAEYVAVPADLLSLLRLDETLGMMRTQGLSAIVRRVRSAGAQLGASGRSA
jgi:cysteine desulfuration protein SufE